MGPRFALTLCALLAACSPAPPGPADPVTVQILAINDFHGHLRPAANADGEPAGGAAHLSTLAQALRAEQPHTVMAGAGDLIGATSLLSSLFHDEPAIEALTAMGLAVSAIGNHEFDRGPDELLRMQHGGCHPDDGCRGPHEFQGAGFTYLAAGAIDLRTGETILPPYEIYEFDGIGLGFIGLTLPGTRRLISPIAGAELEFRDEAETVNALVPELRAAGAEAIVVLLHQGGFPEPGADMNDCAGLTGPILDIVAGFDRAVDAVVTGHTHRAYVCEIDGRLVTSAGRYGEALTSILLTLDPGTGDVVAAEARNIAVDPALYPADPDLSALIAAYEALAEPVLTRPAGRVAAPLTRRAGPAGETPLGRIVADAMLAAAEDAQIAFMNPGGLRADIAGGSEGEVSFNDLFAAQPFGNILTVLTMSGADILSLLEQQFAIREAPIVLQVSHGFSYAWDPARPVGARVIRDSVMLDGAMLEPDRDYRIVTNDFLAYGGEGFTVFARGRDQEQGVEDIAALEAWFGGRSPIAPGGPDRIHIDQQTE